MLKRLALVVALFGVFFIFDQSAFAATKPAVQVDDNALLGEKLVRQLFVDVQKKNIKGLDEFLVPGFQAVYQTGAKDKGAELQLINDMEFKDYTLRNFKVTSEGSALVVTYMLDGDQLIEGKQVKNVSDVRLDCFVKVGSEWKLLAHANLVSVK